MFSQKVKLYVMANYKKTLHIEKECVHIVQQRGYITLRNACAIRHRVLPTSVLYSNPT